MNQMGNNLFAAAMIDIEEKRRSQDSIALAASCYVKAGALSSFAHLLLWHGLIEFGAGEDLHGAITQLLLSRALMEHWGLEDGAAGVAEVRRYGLEHERLGLAVSDLSFFRALKLGWPSVFAPPSVSFYEQALRGMSDLILSAWEVVQDWMQQIRASGDRAILPLVQSAGLPM